MSRREGPPDGKPSDKERLPASEETKRKIVSLLDTLLQIKSWDSTHLLGISFQERQGDFLDRRSGKKFSLTQFKGTPEYQQRGRPRRPLGNIQLLEDYPQEQKLTQYDLYATANETILERTVNLVQKTFESDKSVRDSIVEGLEEMRKSDQFAETVGLNIVTEQEAEEIIGILKGAETNDS